jgi:DNA-binding beta-propeller fold protein YncE
LSEIGCATSNGTSGIDGTKRACADGDALKGAQDVALSPDGKNVYVASYESGGIAIFARDPATGKITQTGCVRGVSTCVGARGLGGASAVVVSPDGANVYLASYNADAVVMFARDGATGALKGLGCISDDGTDRQCASGNTLRGASALVMSKDGRFLYVGASDSNAVLTFERNPATGLLTQRGCILDRAPKGSCSPGHALVTPSALALAPDERTLFVTSYDSNSVVVFARDRTTGVIAERGCVSDPTYEDEPTKDGCVHLQPLISPSAVAVAPDGLRVYVTGDAGLTVLDRDTSTGGLRRAGCAISSQYAEYDETSLKDCSIGTGLAGASGVSTAPDGRTVYVSAAWSSAIAVFAPAATYTVRRALSGHGSVAVRVSCPAELATGCGGRVALYRAGGVRRAATPKPFTLSAGASTTVRLRLAPPETRHLRFVLRGTDRRTGIATIVKRVDLGKARPGMGRPR